MYTRLGSRSRVPRGVALAEPIAPSDLGSPPLIPSTTESLPHPCPASTQPVCAASILSSATWDTLALPACGSLLFLPTPAGLGWLSTSFHPLLTIRALFHRRQLTWLVSHFCCCCSFPAPLLALTYAPAGRTNCCDSGFLFLLMEYILLLSLVTSWPLHRSGNCSRGTCAVTLSLDPFKRHTKAHRHQGH
jgi:hypothetical protein